MTREKWRTPAGVALGFLVSQVVWTRTPSAVFPSGEVVALLSSVGLTVPDWVYNLIERVFASATPVVPAVAAGALVAVVVAGAATVRRGVHTGITVALLDVLLPIAVMIWHVTHGLSFPLMTWLEKVLIQPLTAICVAAFVAAVAGYVGLLATGVRKRVSSSL